MFKKKISGQVWPYNQNHRSSVIEKFCGEDQIIY